MNIYLLTLLHNLLENSGFTVYTHRQVPANDGGIALGQAVIAIARAESAPKESPWEKVNRLLPPGRDTTVKKVKRDA